jgi:hypothetical protein
MSNLEFLDYPWSPPQFVGFKQVFMRVSPIFYERGGTNREVAVVTLSGNGPG